MSANLRPISEGLQEIAIRDLNEVPDRIDDDIAALREWIKKQAHLRSRTDDQFLVAFLRGSKYSLEKAKQKIDRYYTLQALIPEVFTNRSVDNDKVLEIVRMGVIIRVPLPAGETGPCITIIRATIYDTNKYNFGDIIGVGMLFGEIMMLEDDNSTISGYTEIMDMIDVSVRHLLHLPPNLMKRLSVFADEAMPLRQRGTHFINIPPPFEAGFRRLKSWFPEKAMKRISMISRDSDELYNIVPRKLLPVEYGGENGTIADIIAHMEKQLLSYREHFMDESKFGTDEHLRQGAPLNYDSVFGIDGSFRMLDID